MSKGNTSALAAHAKKRSLDVKKRLKAAMESVEKEIDENHGIYPYHKGLVDQTELCRRAGINNTTLQKPTHVETKIWVKNWIERVEGARKRKASSVRGQVTAKVNEYKTAWEEIANKWAIGELQMIETRRENEELKKEIRRLKGINDVLRNRPNSVVMFPEKE